jgi:hypothetical protein
MGAADFGGSLALGGGNPLMARAFQTASAVGGSAYDAKSRGLTDSQAMAEGLLGGAAEYALGKLPLDTLFKTNADDAILKTILKQAGSEAIEEGGTSAVNAIVDSIIAGENSNFNLKKKEYMASGMSEEEATKQAYLDTLKEIGYEGAVGGLSGGVIGGVNTAVKRVRNGSNNSIVNELEPLANAEIAPKAENATEQTQTVEEPIAKTAGSGNTATLNTQPTNTMTNNESGSNSQIKNGNNSHTPEQLKVMEEYSKSFDKDVLDFANMSRDKSVPYVKPLELTKMRDSVADYVLKETGIDTHGNDIILNRSSIEHIDKEHINGNKGKSLITNEDLGRIRWVLDNADEIAMSDEVSLATRTKEGKPAPHLFLRKRIDGHYYVVEAVSDGKKKKNVVISAFVEKVGNEMGNVAKIFKEPYRVSNVSSELEPSTNVQDAHELSSFDLSIPNSSESVNNIVPDLANLDTFNQYASTGKTRVSQTATNTFTNSNMFKKSKLSKQNLEDFIFDGKADVDIVSENESLQRASDMLDKDYAGTIRKLQSNKQYSGAETDAAMMVLEEKLNNAESTGDYADAMKWARMVVDKAHKIGQGLQAFAKYSRTATGTVVKTQKVASDVTEKYFKKNPNLKNSMGKLGTALSQIGNETVNEVGKSAKSIEQIRKEVATALLNEPVSIAKQFGSADVEYLSRAIEKGMTAKDLSKMLEQKLATGSFGISDSDINEIIRLFDEADKYGETSKQSYDLQQKAFAIAAKYIGNSSFMDKWNAWRYLAMLGNTRTHIKNTGGNSSMYVVSGIKNNVAAVLEGLVDKASGGRIDRTKSVLNMASAKDRNLVNSSSKDAYEIYTMLNEGGSKYDMKKEIESNKKVYKNKVLNALSNFNSMALEKEDFFFLKAKYSTSLAGYLKANNLDASIFNSTNEADIEKLNNARDYAIKEAQKATFHEASGLAEKLNNISKGLANGNVGEKALGMLMEGVLPFKKTPINVLKQGLRYSPASIVKGITTDMIQLKKGNKTASEVIEDFSTGMTGSAIVALGMFLFENGLLSSAASSDDEEKRMDDLIGKQNYALQFPDGSSYTIDWLAPSSLPLFVGAELAKMMQGEDGSILDAFMSIADPIVEMSMLQGIDDTLNSIKNSDDSKIGELLAHTAAGYLSQAVPTLLGQVARSVDDTRRNTYTDKTGIEGILGKATNKVLNKIPGVSKESEEYVDEWGRTEENVGGNVLGRLAYNMLSPGYYSKENVTSVDAELMDLARSTGDTSIYPNYTNSRPISGEGKLSPEDYTKYATEKGQAQYDALDALFNSTTYSNLSDGNKVNVISDIYEFTNAIAKKEALNKNVDSDLNKAMKAFNEKGYDGVAKFYSIKELASRKNGTSPNLDDYVNAVNKMNLTEEEKGYYLSVLNSPSSNETKEIARVSNVKMAYGLDGLYDYYTIKSQIDTDKKITAYDVVSQYDLTDEEKGFYLRTLDTSDKDKKRAKLDSIEDAYGLDGLYDWYIINNNTIKDSNAGKIIAIDAMDMTDDEKGYYLSLYFDSLSKDAERILENNGYGALYRYYYNKTEKDRIKLLQSNGL